MRIRIPGNLRGHSLRRAFTLIEMLVSLLVLAILISLVLPALSRSKALALSIACRNNLKQLQFAYTTYAHENNDNLPLNNARSYDGLGDVRSTPGSWVVGNAQRDTNTSNIEAGSVFRYIDNARSYACPADASVISGTGLRRTRGYSLDGWLNGSYTAKAYDFNPLMYPWSRLKLSEGSESPSSIFAFIDEHEQGIDCGVFIVVQPPEIAANDSNNQWDSLPSDRHQQASALSFLDGHTDLHRWQHPKRYLQFRSPANRDLSDLRWLESHVPHEAFRDSSPGPHMN